MCIRDRHNITDSRIYFFNSVRGSTADKHIIERSNTGLIGYLRADFGSTGNEFWTTWNDFRKDLKPDEFKAEFDDVINGLRDGDVLSGRKAMSSYCYSLSLIHI